MQGPKLFALQQVQHRLEKDHQEDGVLDERDTRQLGRVEAHVLCCHGQGHSLSSPSAK